MCIRDRLHRAVITNLDEDADNCETFSFVSGSADAVIVAVEVHKVYLKQQQPQCVQSSVRFDVVRWTTKTTSRLLNDSAPEIQTGLSCLHWSNSGYRSRLNRRGSPLFCPIHLFTVCQSVTRPSQDYPDVNDAYQTRMWANAQPDGPCRT